MGGRGGGGGGVFLARGRITWRRDLVTGGRGASYYQGPFTMLHLSWGAQSSKVKLKRESYQWFSPSKPVGGGRGGGRSLYLQIHCHHQNDFRVKMGSDVSHFNVSLIVQGKDTRQCP